MMPSLALHRTSVRPYQRGFYCSDYSLNYPFKKSTIPSSVLTSVGLTLPVVSVSPPTLSPRPPSFVHPHTQRAFGFGEHSRQKQGGHGGSWRWQ